VKTITIEFIPQYDQRFTTQGDWWETADTLQVRVTQCDDWRYQVPVLMHELIEFFWCKAHGVTTEECDAFDVLFEQEYEDGKWNRTVEAGFDRRCPYRGGHKWGHKFERLTCWMLRVSWMKYEEYMDSLIGE
jgi:hypothetical protein